MIVTALVFTEDIILKWAIGWVMFICLFTECLWPWCQRTVLMWPRILMFACWFYHLQANSPSLKANTDGQLLELPVSVSLTHTQTPLVIKKSFLHFMVS